MKKRERLSTFIGELILLIASIIMMIPVYYFIIGAMKGRVEIVRYPLKITIEWIKENFVKNFSYAWDKMKMLESIKNTGTITLVSLVFVIICGSLAGFAIARVERKAFRLYYSLLIALMVIPFIGCLIPIVVQSTQLGTYGTLLGCILVQTAWNLPFSVFLYTGFMQGLPKELEEAAYIDGCSMIGTYFKIFLPLLAPVTATCCIRAGMGMWNDYLVSSSLLNVNKYSTLMVQIKKFFGNRKTEYGYAFAGIILASLPIIVMFLFLQKYFIKGLAAGAVKG